MATFAYAVEVTKVVTMKQTVLVQSSSKLPRKLVKQYAEEIAADNGDASYNVTAKVTTKVVA